MKVGASTVKPRRCTGEFSNKTTSNPKHSPLISPGHQITQTHLGRQAGIHRRAHTLSTPTGAEAGLHRSRHDRTTARLVSSSAVPSPPPFASRGRLTRCLFSSAGGKRTAWLAPCVGTVGHAGDSRRSRRRARDVACLDTSSYVHVLYDHSICLSAMAQACVCPTWTVGTHVLQHGVR
jgi:hypothetical protein